MTNKLDKPFKVGDRVVVNAKGAGVYPSLSEGLAGIVVKIPQERWHNNEIVVQWDIYTGKKENSMLACWAFDLDLMGDYEQQEEPEYWCNCPKCGKHTFENLPNALLKCVGCGHEF